MSDDNSLLDKFELAALLGLKAETVCYYSRNYPHRVPPRVSWSKKPQWNRAVVERWIAERSGQKDNPALEPKAKPETVKPKRAPGRPRAAAF